MEIANYFTESAGIRFVLDLNIDHEKVPKYIQHQLYRIAQEAITNAVRHANASNIRITLAAEQDRICLSVLNDGLPLPAKIEQGLGTRLMQHRTLQLGGQLGWSTTNDGFTCLNCAIPQPLE